MLFCISSNTTIPGEFFSTFTNSSKSKSFSNSILIDSLCELNTGTLTVVAVIGKLGLFNILRVH